MQSSLFPIIQVRSLNSFCFPFLVWFCFLFVFEPFKKKTYAQMNSHDGKEQRTKEKKRTKKRGKEINTSRYSFSILLGDPLECRLFYIESHEKILT